MIASGSGGLRGGRGELGVLALLAVATTVLTWPLAGSPGEAIAAREDYFLNLWNIWWLKETLFREGASIYHSDFIHHPLGVSLVRHVLNPVSAIPGALLAAGLGLHDVYKALVWIHFWLSGYCFFLFARALTGSPGGALLAGLFWTFGPFHLFYLAQMNVLSMEFLPLAGFFLVRSHREGRARDAVGVAVAAGLLAGSSQYFLVYAGFLGALLLLGGRLWSPDGDARRGALRLAGAGALAALAVLAVSWRTLLAAGAGADPALAAETERQLGQRSNDLLGFLWAVPPERVLLSWPAMLGYSSLALVLIGVRRDPQRLFWLGFAALFALLSFGAELHVAGRATGIPLPYGLFSDLPLLWMLRKPDRSFVLVLMGLGVLLAFGWRDLADQLGTSARRRLVGIAFGVAICLERAALPLSTFALATSPHLEALAADDTVTAVVDLPPYGAGAAAGRSNHFQTIHGKKITQGYVVNLALSPAHHRASRRWAESYAALARGDAGPVVAAAEAADANVLILHKTVPVIRKPDPLDGRILWAPFVVHGRRLVELRQRGLFDERPQGPVRLAIQRQALADQLGEPSFEDDAVAVFRVDRTARE